MSNLTDGLSIDVSDILKQEYLDFKDYNRGQKPERSYYVYALYALGDIYYVGKGKGNRAYAHLNKHSTNSIKDCITKWLYSIDEPPVVYIIRNNLLEYEALELEKKTIEEYGRIINGSGVLSNMIPGDDRYNNKESARNGGLIHNIRGTRGGCFSTKWRENNKDKITKNASEAGKESWRIVSLYMKDEHSEWSKRGGVAMANMVFWTNGYKTTRSIDCPGSGWIRGNGSFNKKSIGHNSYPCWTNGYVVKMCLTKPGPDYFNGTIRKHKDGKNIVVYSKQEKGSVIPLGFKLGYNIIKIDKEV